MTQTQVGEYLHISQRSYAHYEAGTREIPIDILMEIADLFEVNIILLEEQI